MAAILANQTHVHIVTLVGADSAKTKSKMSELLVSIPKEERLIIIATEKYIGVDIHIPVLERMYNKQLTGYAQIRYKTLSSKNEPDKISIIYDSDTFVSAIKMTL